MCIGSMLHVPKLPFTLVGCLHTLCVTVGARSLCIWLLNFYLAYSSCTPLAVSKVGLIVVCNSLARATVAMAGYGLCCPLSKL